MQKTPIIFILGVFSFIGVKPTQLISQLVRNDLMPTKSQINKKIDIPWKLISFDTKSNSAVAYESTKINIVNSQIPKASVKGDLFFIYVKMFFVKIESEKEKTKWNPFYFIWNPFIYIYQEILEGLALVSESKIRRDFEEP